MGNKATKAEETSKMEIQISGDQPFKPGELINGEVIVTTAKPLKDISGIEVKFEGGSWFEESYMGRPGEPIDRYIYVDKSINLAVDEDQLKLPRQHRFAFSFNVPQKCKSSMILSQFKCTKYSIAASIQGKGEDLCSQTRDLTILAPPTEPAGKMFDQYPNRTCCSRPEHPFGQMTLQLPDRVFEPGELIPITGTFRLNTNRAGPFKIKASLGFGDGRIIPTSPAAEEEEGGQTLLEVERAEIVEGHQTITWKDEKFHIPAHTPTESSLFHRLRHRRYLIIAMEQCKKNDKPERLELRLPIQIGDY